MTEYEKRAIREARNAYRREWNRKNRDKVRAIQERYWLRKYLEQQKKEESKADGR